MVRKQSPRNRRLVGIVQKSLNEAGANAITYTPSTAQELFKITMAKYREM